MIYVDIDGVLNDYPISYIDYLKSETNKSFDNLNEAKMNLPYSKYVQLRTSYRLHVEPCLPVNEEVCMAFHGNSPYMLFIATKRPIMEYTHLENTMSFLRKTKLRYQQIVYWNKNLNDLNIPFLVRYAKAAVEDNFKIAKFLSCRFSMPTFVLLNDNNRPYIKTVKKVPSVKYGSADELRNFLENII